MDGARKEDGDGDIRGDAKVAECVGELVGVGLELLVGEGVGMMVEGDVVGVELGDLLEGLMNGRRQGQKLLSLVPVVEE